jgi:spermidine synthase
MQYDQHLKRMKPFERLAEARTPNGTLIELYRHNGSFLIRAGGLELMSSRRHLSEDRLAEVGCASLQQSAHACVLIGGLGLGFTLRAALNLLHPNAEVVVAEIMSEVIEWNAGTRSTTCP